MQRLRIANKTEVEGVNSKCLKPNGPSVNFDIKMESRGCVHLDMFKEEEGIKTYKVLHAVFVICANAAAKKTKMANAHCYVCKRVGPFMHACLHCIFFGCHKHIREHGKQHDLSMDLIYGQIHCSSCGDYVYDPEMEKIAMENKMEAGVCRKRLFNWTTWNPSKEELDLLKHKFKAVLVTPETTLGLRGLINLDSTCFMNCTMQVLIHTPLLRDYFLADHHKCKMNPKECLVCQLSELFQKCYNGEREPIALHQMLHLIWKHCNQLGEVSQQDAHEFFTTTLEMLHMHCKLSMSSTEQTASDLLSRCHCIIDQVFGGQLQSLLVCQTCNDISPTVDPTWDFSLEISAASSLTECLKQFTKAEYLGKGRQCPSCKACDSTKQLTLKTLPIVVTIHLKRFTARTKEESTNGEKMEMLKLSKRISFPETLDLTEFVTRNSVAIVPSDNRYSLFAVVNHEGTSCNGHYITFVRKQKGYWYECNDSEIIPVSIQKVLDSEAYLLFYHKHVLEYD